MESLRRSRLDLMHSRSRGERIALAAASIAGLALLGAAGFGLVHVVGGALHGNPRAVSFGVRLTVASVLTFAAGALLLRRVERGR